MKKVLLLFFLGTTALAEQPMCGTSCKVQRDKNNKPYCVCKGRKGRAKLDCCRVELLNDLIKTLEQEATNLKEIIKK